MIEVIRAALLGQLHAALSTLGDRIESCPDDCWNAPVANHLFCQVVFHTLFYTDVYLGIDSDALKVQPFHAEHADYFRNYEELIDKKPELLYDRPTTRLYLAHCRDKAETAINAETERSLGARSGFPWLPFSRAEVYIYITRHIQHHAAQLILRQRLDETDDARWHKSG